MAGWRSRSSSDKRAKSDSHSIDSRTMSGCTAMLIACYASNSLDEDVCRKPRPRPPRNKNHLLLRSSRLSRLQCSRFSAECSFSSRQIPAAVIGRKATIPSGTGWFPRSSRRCPSWSSSAPWRFCASRRTSRRLPAWRLHCWPQSLSSTCRYDSRLQPRLMEPATAFSQSAGSFSRSSTSTT
jgi:hypothetical protein